MTARHYSLLLAASDLMIEPAATRLITLIMRATFYIGDTVKYITFNLS